ncbi:MAG: prolipoprotein diacylglyceryl transferase [Gammaproteobacteria bacterium]|nr:prolipoprotein diacylglyceryl transferase [Gammaproteobacteria bacterium]
MFVYPEFDPVALALGPLQIRWYGLMYLVGIAAGWYLLRWRAAKPGSGWTLQKIDDLVFVSVIGVIVGGRVGSKLFYDLDAWLVDPLSIFEIWKGGMSFHGGLLGVAVAMLYFGRKNKIGFFQIADMVVPVVPLGLGAGRIGNFINGELWGKVTDMPVGFLVNGEIRHATQLYEFLLEGVVMFAVLWWLSSTPRPRMLVSGMFALLYGVFRFLVEFVRMPDAHIGYLAGGWLTMGQVLSLPLLALGLVLVVLALRGNNTPEVKA